MGPGLAYLDEYSPHTTTTSDLHPLFFRYGKVAVCDIVKNFDFVHMDDKAEAEEAIRSLHQYELNGQPMDVELSRGKSRASTKRHVGNIARTNQALQDYAFVDMERVEDASVDNTAFKGKLMNAQQSTSLRCTALGMGDQPGRRRGHWLMGCPVGWNCSHGDRMMSCSNRVLPRAPPGYGRGGYGRARAPASDYIGGSACRQAPDMRVLAPPATNWFLMRYRHARRVAVPCMARSSAYDRDRYSSFASYKKYRARPYDSRYFQKRRRFHFPPPPPPPSSPSSSPSRLSSSIAPYDRQTLPSTSSASAAAANDARDGSPVRRGPVTSASQTYEHPPNSSVSGSRISSYAALRAYLFE
ncbi:RNA-binding protein 4.1-like [Lampris incognitus]|uniref:RNA-binding protein 4.1-like n=1 Tax=Lampris incognitus TaxID=2546036 RepID=UPI0024B60FF9|nr:RNA-binding protein 4.1-like [Lampris incognitus]